MQKQISTLIGVIIIVVVAVILFGGVFAYEQHANSKSLVTTNVKTSNWKTYTNTQYGYEIKYPTNWIADSDLLAYTNDGAGSVAFCPPELQTNKTNGLTNKIGACLVGSTNGGSIDPQAPIVLRQCVLHSSMPLEACGSPGAGTPNMGTDKNGQYGYTLFLFNPKYREMYNEILSTFKFTN